MATNTSKMRNMRLDDVLITAEVDPTVTVTTEKIIGGQKIATIKVGEKETELYAPKTSSEGSVVTISETKAKGSNIAKLTIDGTSTYIKSSIVEIADTLEAGTTIAKLTIDGTPTTIKAPAAGSNVTVNPTTFSAKTKIADITVDGTSTDIYCPKVEYVNSLADTVAKTEIGKIKVNNTPTTIYAPTLNTDNVVLAEDVLFRGNYTLGLKKTTYSATYTAKKGTTLTQLLKDLFTGDVADKACYFVKSTDINKLDEITTATELIAASSWSSDDSLPSTMPVATTTSDKVIALYISSAKNVNSVTIAGIAELDKIDCPITGYDCFRLQDVSGLEYDTTESISYTFK